MKTKSQALNVVPSQNVDLLIRPFLSKKNEFTSQLLGCEVNNSHLVCFLLVSFFALLTFIFATDMVALYGWSAFFALSAVCVTYLGLRDVLKNLSED